MPAILSIAPLSVKCTDEVRLANAAADGLLGPERDHDTERKQAKRGQGPLQGVFDFDVHRDRAYHQDAQTDRRRPTERGKPDPREQERRAEQLQEPDHPQPTSREDRTPGTRPSDSWRRRLAVVSPFRIV